VEVNDLTGRPAGMLNREAAVVDGVPVLRRDHPIEAADEAVGHRDDGVTGSDGEGAAGQEIVLKVDEDERTHGRRIDRPARKV
jgi:hypothetical protein